MRNLASIRFVFALLGLFLPLLSYAQFTPAGGSFERTLASLNSSMQTTGPVISVEYMSGGSARTVFVGKSTTSEFPPH